MAKWEKGSSGNPGGRPVYKPFIDAVNIEIAAAGPDRIKLRRIAKKILDEAEEGAPWACQLLFERLDGKVPQPVEVDQTVTHIAIDERQARIRELQQKAITTSYREVEDTE
jgi:hypothetical protein